MHLPVPASLVGHLIKKWISPDSEGVRLMLESTIFIFFVFCFFSFFVFCFFHFLFLLFSFALLIIYR